MDHQLLVDKILAKVMERISEKAEQGETTNKNKVLILSEIHQTICHQLLENKSMQANWEIDCAYLKEYCCNVEEYDTVAIYDLSNQSLVKIAGGIGDTPFTQIAMKAILLGKKIIIPKTEVELFQYKETAPQAYYGMLKEKLNLLVESGAILCDLCELEKCLGITPMTNSHEEPVHTIKQELDLAKKASSVEAPATNIVAINKKVITESDIRKLLKEGTTGISIGAKALLTDVAKEYLQNRRIEIQRQAAMDGR